MSISLEHIRAAAEQVYQHMLPTPQYQWPLLNEKLGTQCWVKHENHTPLGAFKVRGGIHYFSELASLPTPPSGVIAATRGNHGQSVGYAARLAGLPCTIVVPHGNSLEKNAAMRAQGVDLIEAGDDFQASREIAQQLATENDWHMVPPFHEHLVAGVATYCLELFQSVADLDVIYVPVGMGSGICAMLSARNALGLNTEIIGVVSSHAPAYANSFVQGEVVSAPATTELADGLACRQPDATALAMIQEGVSRFVKVSDEQVQQAMRDIYSTTHNIAEGAAAAAYAAAYAERDTISGRRIAIVLTGGNVDKQVFAQALLAA